MLLTQEVAESVSHRVETPPDELCKLPVFRPVAVRLLSELAKEEADIGEVTNLLHTDPAFSAEILTHANSALYSRKARIDTIQRAIVVLGLERTRTLTATVALQGMMRNTINKAVSEGCWAHSRATAIVAEWVAPFYQLHPEKAYTAGLMHDIGRLAMLSAYPEYPALLSTMAGTNGDLLKAERLSFSVDHCEAGRWLTRIWALPIEFGDSASQHHELVTGTGGDRIDLIRLSCLLAQSLGYKAAARIECESPEDLVARIPEEIYSRSRFSVPKLAECLHEALQAENG